MSKTPSLSSKELIAALKRSGARDAPHKGKGSHRALVRIDENEELKLIIIPHPVKDLPKGTLRAILKQAGLTLKELKDLL